MKSREKGRILSNDQVASWQLPPGNYQLKEVQYKGKDIVLLGSYIAGDYLGHQQS